MVTRRILMRSLAVAVVIASVIWTITAEDIKVLNSCCRAVRTAEVADPIIGFRFQRESLPCVKAVIFETEWGNKQGIYFCSDPKQRWVREKVKQFLKQTPGFHTTPNIIY
ncbi:hypothetical protein G5714_023338 [Onychostoma macrolepis]|uniref:Chemokine interleukin-8-like domain-containing protein n=1 Tax=Onychostoma macrolepis TaxID=369639 RepID=A0A7J6BN91_9TELE|nr:hypothetical protein G5714_023338 [Onychostoma macrolepis]